MPFFGQKLKTLQDKKVKELSATFLASSPSVESDSIIHDLDEKHKRIVSSAVMNLRFLDSTNFRNWSEQSDLGAPAQFSLASGLFLGVIRPAYVKLFRRAREREVLRAFMDDLKIIDEIGAHELLRHNPVRETPGVTHFFDYKGLSVNYRWLRYIYLLKRITDMGIINHGGIWVDIGSYYGGLQGLVHKYSPKARVVLVDFHHQLCRSYIYLSMVHPNANHILPDMIKSFPSLIDVPEGSFIYVPVTDFGLISNESVDLVTNFFSFGEMKRNTFLNYFNSRLIRDSRILYLVNRFVSSPFFEPTYDSDLTVLDYLTSHRITTYFDVFPIHHYYLHYREIFGSAAARNTSSSYFEYVSAFRPSRS